MKINKKILAGLAATALIVASGSSAFGYTVTLTQTGFNYGSGGEFTATVSDTSLSAYIASYDQPLGSASVVGTGNSVAQSFQTFCIEHTENFVPTYAYTPSGITDSAKLGGMGVSDHLSVGTAYLYSEFAKGTLAGYAFDGGAAARSVSAGALQDAIWWLENEIAGNSGNIPKPSNSFVTLVEGLFGTVGTQTAGANGDGLGAASDSYSSGGTYVGAANNATFGVYALNMGTTTQDQLIYLTPGNATVPDGGATVLLLGMAMAGVGVVRRYLR